MDDFIYIPSYLVISSIQYVQNDASLILISIMYFDMFSRASNIWTCVLQNVRQIGI